jgi:hypothetical protein
MIRSRSLLGTDTSTAKDGWPRPRHISMSGLVCRPVCARPGILSNNGVLRLPKLRLWVSLASRRRFSSSSSRSMVLSQPRRRRQRRLLSPRPLNPRHRLRLRPLRALLPRSASRFRKRRRSPLRQLSRPSNPIRRQLLRPPAHLRFHLSRLPLLNRGRSFRLPANRYSTGQSQRVRRAVRTPSRRRPGSSMSLLRGLPARQSHRLRKTRTNRSTAGR